jgi:hypothetical protein
MKILLRAKPMPENVPNALPRITFSSPRRPVSFQNIATVILLLTYKTTSSVLLRPLGFSGATGFQAMMRTRNA